MKILVAKQTIPSGVEITGDFVIFQEVPVSEIPHGALFSFAQVFRRQPAYPIPVGCPICEDLLAPKREIALQTTFQPIGSQFVTLDVVQIRQGEKVYLPNESISEVLAADQRIDVRVVHSDDAHGKLAEMKKEVLRTFASNSFREKGELLLEDVPIHQIQRQSTARSTGSLLVSLLLAPSEAGKLTAAAKKGHIRILVRQEMHQTAALPVELENEGEVTDFSEPTMPVSLPFEPFPIDVPRISEQLLPVSQEPELTVPTETAEKTVPEPTTADIFDPILPPAPTPESDVALLSSTTSETAQNVGPPLDVPAVSSTPEFIVKEKIRNDAPMVSFGPPALRIISERSAEQNPVLTKLVPPSEFEWAGTVPHSSQYLTELPPISPSIRFQSPGKVAAVKEFPKEPTKQIEIAATPMESPTFSSAPLILQERVQGYSPFERRVYTVALSEDELNESSDDLQTPPLLLRSADTDKQAQ